MPRVLFVFTSASKTLKDTPTGWWISEASIPYYILEPHAQIDFAAPAGPNPPVEPLSVQTHQNDEDIVKFITRDTTVKSKFDNAKKLSDVNPDQYDAVFYPGGHGPVLDLASDPVNAKLASSFWNANKTVAAVCHGPAALVRVMDSNGKSIFQGRNATGFSNAEEEAFNGVDKIPFLLESKIQELGGKYQKAEKLWEPKVIVDGKLITGQNPGSAKEIGEALLKALQQ